MSDLQDTRVLVTGAGGFIGSHLVEALVRSGFGVRAFVRYNARDSWGHLDELAPDVLAEVDVVAGDLRDEALVREAVGGCDIVFHLAALIGIPHSFRAPRSYVDTNVGGTLNLLEAARTHDVQRVVHTSTSEVYGSAQQAAMSEDHPLAAHSPYAASKIAADKLAESYHRSFGLPVVTLRPFNTYGPRQSARAIIPTIIAQAEVGTDIALGNLAPVRDFLFVEDTVAGFLAAASTPGIEGETFHLGTGQGVAIGDLAAQILTLMERMSTCVVVTSDERLRSETSEVDALVCSADKARDQLGWHPTFSLETGLTRTIEYVRAHLSRYRAERYTT